MRKLFCLVMGLLLATPALATVRVDEDGVSKGYVKNLDFQNGPSITKTGINAAIDYDGAFDADYLRLNGTNTPSADYSWTTDLETTGSVTAEHLHSTDDASITNDITVGGNAVITTTGRVIFDAEIIASPTFTVSTDTYADNDTYMLVSTSKPDVLDTYVDGTKQITTTDGLVTLATDLTLTGKIYHATDLEIQAENSSILIDSDIGKVQFQDDGTLMHGFNANRDYDQAIHYLDDDAGNQLIITNVSNAGKDHDHAVQTNPTLYIHSDTNPNTANDEWISFTHDVTNPLVDWGSGKLNFTGDTKTITGTSTYLETSELYIDLSGVGLGDVYMPVLVGKAYSSVIPIPYAVAVWDKFAIMDHSDSDELSILFVKPDFSASAEIFVDLANGYFTANWDWCPSDDDTYDLGTPALRWRNIYSSGGSVQGTTRYTANQTLDSEDRNVFCDGTFTVSLPAGVSGTYYRIINAGTGVITIAPNGAENLIGANSSITIAASETIILVYETTEGWY